MASKTLTPFMRWCERCETVVSSDHRRVTGHQPVMLFSRTGRTYRGLRP